MITFAIVAISFTIGLATMAYGEVSDTYYNLYLEAKVNLNESTLSITKFKFNNTQICPSGQCKFLYEKNPSGYFSGPDIPESNLITANFEFRAQDDIGHANMGEKKKAFIEHYRMNIICEVYDIDEDKGQENYYCKNDNLFGTEMTNKFTPPYWTLDISGIFAAKNNTFGIYGIFTEEKYDLSRS